jgi:hypothetical protein
VSASAKIVLAGLDNYGATDDRVRADQLYQPVLKIHIRNARLVRLDVPQISHHPLLIIRCAVVPAERIEDATGSYEALREIAEDVDVKAVLSLQVSQGAALIIRAEEKRRGRSHARDGYFSELTGSNPLMLPSMLVGASSWAWCKMRVP